MRLSKSQLRKVVKRIVEQAEFQEDWSGEASARLSKRYPRLMSRSDVKAVWQETYNAAYDNASWSGIHPRDEDVLLGILEKLG